MPTGPSLSFGPDRLKSPPDDADTLLSGWDDSPGDTSARPSASRRDLGVVCTGSESHRTHGPGQWVPSPARRSLA